jgi:predicted nucleotidyltransferase
VTLPRLTDAERRCLERYVALLAERLEDDLVEVVVFGSVARGEAWPAGMPMRSDLDLAVLTRRELSAEEKDALFEPTYPLFLECGRQISPAIVKEPSESLAEAIARDGIRVWPR